MTIVPLQDLSPVECASLGSNVLAAWRRRSARRNRQPVRRLPAGTGNRVRRDFRPR
jgi:hypothetical protein